MRSWRCCADWPCPGFTLQYHKTKRQASKTANILLGNSYRFTISCQQCARVLWVCVLFFLRDGGVSTFLKRKFLALRNKRVTPELARSCSLWLFLTEVWTYCASRYSWWSHLRGEGQMWPLQQRTWSSRVTGSQAHFSSSADSGQRQVFTLYFMSLHTP